MEENMASDQRIVCVTGATSGIGRATALRFLKEGWKVIAVGRRRERLEELAAGGGPALLPLPQDVGDREAEAKAFSSLPETFKPLDVLVNNAGGAHGRDTIMNASLDDWETMINVNIKGVLYCTMAVVKDMVKRDRGHIVNIGSVASFFAYPGANAYGGTKAFVAQFTQNLRSDLHGTKVRTTTIEPGLLESEFSLVRFKGDAERAGAVYADCRPLLPEDLADIIHYVVSVPPHVNIGRLQVMPVCQSDGGSVIYKGRNR
jgi:NADP-dependent 3-hydroxy acid dehydrogenase YdfG